MTLSFKKQLAVNGAVSLIVAIAVVTIFNQVTDNSSPTFLMNASERSVDAQTIVVSRADLRSQFSVPGTVVDNPPFLLLASADGELSQEVGTGLVDANNAVGRVSGEPVVTPRQIELLEWLVPDGSTVAAGLPVAEVRLVGFAVSVAVEGADGYRLLAGSDLTGRASIDAGPGPFDCPVVQPAQPGGDDEEASDSSTVGVLCLIPDDVKAVTDVPATLLITNSVVTDVLVLPVTAVRGLVESGEVLVRENGVQTRRVVALGVTDGIMIEITDGLEEGDEVMATAPSLGEL